MGLWDTLFDSDFRQRQDIDVLKSSTGVARSETAILSARVKSLQQTIDRQELLMEALFRITLGRGLATEEEFKDLIAQIERKTRSAYRR